jgi:sugar fermentation stimulation protein A
MFTSEDVGIGIRVNSGRYLSENDQKTDQKPIPRTMSISVEIRGPLHASRFVRRYNRFLLQVRLDDTGDLEDVHMADPGRLKELLIPGNTVWVRPAGNPGRKTRWTAVLVESPGGGELVSLDTTLPNRLVKTALESRALEELAEWTLLRSEFSLGRSRLDFLLSGRDDTRMALEVKSVTLVEEGVGLFPDAVTKRGARHVRELAEASQREDWEAAVLLVLQRSDAHRIRAARTIDPAFADALDAAKSAGVKILGRRCRVQLDRVELVESVPVDVG